jgi:hypothetical protein
MAAEVGTMYKEAPVDVWLAQVQSMGEAVEAQFTPALDLDLVVMIGVYAICGLWLVHLWRIRNRPEGRDHIAQAIELGDAIFGLLAAVAFLGLGILIAVARASGRSHGRRW